MARRTVLAMGMAGAIGLAMAPQAQAAGFFDDLARVFGARPTPPAQIDNSFEMTVKPRQAKPRTAAVAKPSAPAVKLDPATDAFWHLRDPTLRKGDIVVTRSGIVVFDGRPGSEHMQSDFASLSRARNVSAAQQKTLQAAAAGARSYFGQAPIQVSSVMPVQEAKADETAR